jgi:predicted Zn-ribbon and HTH transcriptional regulator
MLSMISKSPSTPAEDRETVRRQIRAFLEDSPHSAKEISFSIRRPEKEIENHLEHLQKSLRAEGRRLTQVPAECRGCGFVFRKRERLKAPGRCPLCKGESISDPSFRVEGG